MSDIEEILQFWFGPAGTDPVESDKRSEFWYGSGSSIDAEILDRFGKTHKSAERKELEHWAESGRGSLALVVLLDQFSRHIYRGSASAFFNDNKALEVAGNAIAHQQNQQLSLIERAFLYHPYHHSESRNNQEQCVALFESLESMAPDPWKKQITSFADSARGHREIIRQFGRFPHRNAVLSRENSDAEQAYLDRGGSRFGQ